MPNIIRCILSCAAIIILTASCETVNIESKYAGKSSSIIFEKAEDLFYKKEYYSAKLLYNKVYSENPASKFAARAMLGEANSLMQLDKDKHYEEAIGTLDGFLKLYPVHPQADYAHYLKAMCNFNRLSNVGKQLKLAIEAKNVFEVIVEKYRDTKYGKLAAKHLETVKNHIASHYMYIGNFYLKNYEPIAAIGRYEQVLAEYPESKVRAQVLVHLVEGYTMLGIKEIAIKYNNQLKNEFPDHKDISHTDELINQFNKSSDCSS